MAIDFKDYYQVLGLSRDASEADIKKAFRNLARKYHPDVAKDKKTAEAKFKEINEAHEVLSDPEKRKKYDELGANWQNAGAGVPDPRQRNGAGGYGVPGQDYHFGGTTGFSDFFEQFFSGSAGNRGYEDAFRQARTRPSSDGEDSMPGSDIEGDVLVTLDEAFRGSSRQITLQRTNPLTGELDTEMFTVRIPPGATEGRRIRVRRKGGHGIGSGDSGDLFLRVRFAAHPEFEARGADLYHDLKLAPWDAALGAQVVIPTLSGRVKLRVPSGTQHDRQFRVRGQGLPKGTTGERGDLYATAKIEMPTELTTEERELWEKLAQASRSRSHSPEPDSASR